MIIKGQFSWSGYKVCGTYHLCKCHTNVRRFGLHQNSENIWGHVGNLFYILTHSPSNATRTTFSQCSPTVKNTHYCIKSDSMSILNYYKRPIKSNWCKKDTWVASWQNQQCGCAPSEHSDQPAHPPSLIRVCAVHLMGSQGPKVSSCGQRRLWSVWADAQADLSFCWGHNHIVGFVMSQLTWFYIAYDGICVKFLLSGSLVSEI